MKGLSTPRLTIKILLAIFLFFISCLHLYDLITFITKIESEMGLTTIVENISLDISWFLLDIFLFGYLFFDNKEYYKYLKPGVVIFASLIIIFKISLMIQNKDFSIKTIVYYSSLFLFLSAIISVTYATHEIPLIYIYILLFIPLLFYVFGAITYNLNQASINQDTNSYLYVYATFLQIISSTMVVINYCDKESRPY